MSDKITYQELVHTLSQRIGKSQQETDTFVHALAGVIESALVTDSQTHLAHFGKWEKRHYKARPGRHPQTGERIQIPAHERAVFKPYKALRETVNSDFLHLEARPVSSTANSSGSRRVEQRSVTPGPERKESSRVEEEEPLLRVRERPSHAGPPPFFISLDEQANDSVSGGDLVHVRPSPVTEQQGDTEKD